MTSGVSAETDPKEPRLNVPTEGKRPTASQNEPGCTTADPMTEFLTAITQTFEEINKHLVDQYRRIEELRQAWKFGDNNIHVVAGGRAWDTLPEIQAPQSSERDQVPRPVLPEIKSPFRYSRTSVKDVQPTVES